MTVEPSAPQQEALWWVQQRSTRKDLYNLTWRMAVGDLDPTVLGRAWQAVVDRHEALRTALVAHDGAVWQEISATAPAVLTELAWPAPAAPAGTDLFDLVATHTHRRPFELGRAPLARLCLVTVGDRHELLLTVHHAVLDGWSVQRVVKELAQAYDIESRRPGGASTAFDSEPVPFLPHARAARTALADGSWQESIDFWVRHLGGGEPVACATVLPDRAPAGRAPDDLGSPGAVLRHRLSPAAVDGVRGLTKRGGMTPIAGYLAAVHVVLARGGAGTRVAVGVAVANRLGERDERCVGYLTNVVVAAGTVHDDDTLDEVVGRARDDFWDGLEHQQVPYAVMHAALPVEARERIGAMPAVLLTYHGHIGGSVRLGDRETELLASPSTGATNDLALGVFEHPDGTTVEVEYDTGRFDAATVLRFLADLDGVLAHGGRADVPVQALRVASRTAPAYRIASAHRVGPANGSAGPPVADGSTVGPVNPVADVVTGLWRRTLRVDEATADTDFFDLGGHSLQVFDLMAEIERHTGAPVDVLEWLDRPTLGRLITLSGPPGTGTETAEMDGPAGDATLRAGTGDGVHLHLIRPAGGADHSIYRELVAALPQSWRITGAPDDDAWTVPALAERYASALLAQPRLPDIIGGWSFGGLVAYAITLRLRQQGVQPPRLLIVDSSPPDGAPANDDEGDLEAFVGVILRSIDAGHLVPPRLRLDDDDVEHGLGVLDALLHGHGSPVPIEVLRHRLTAMVRHWRAMGGYVSTEPVDTPAVLVDAELGHADVEGWTTLLGSGTIVVDVDTDHYAAMKEPSVRGIAAALTKLAESTVEVGASIGDR
ncbi:condensation domain-containing protein [Micromonospora sp. WMMD956]|uniref:condensation domain-containing protein n=1 Tax=Micromonospora sp. WMMD956 TaxID=3016108 RepID=UPI002417BC96|nr:condensation domain-containing protein [Micromonospora sp. WMMD956]MDG4820146.1 condensation domain-containing protein [Micromonospora sp. WMMD956]